MVALMSPDPKLFRKCIEEMHCSCRPGSPACLKGRQETKFFLIGGYAFEEEESRPFGGAGIEQGLADGLYVTAFYRQLFSDGPYDADVCGLGIGLEF